MYRGIKDTASRSRVRFLNVSTVAMCKFPFGNVCGETN